MKKVYDKEGREIPDLKQLGINEHEFEEKMMGDPKVFDNWYNPKVLGWQLKREAEKRTFLARKAEKEKLEEMNHWYNSLSAEKKAEIINRVIPKADDILILFLQKLSMKSPMYQYYMTLSNRVKAGNLELKAVPYRKLKKFPKYNALEDDFYGATDQFINMFVALFPPRRKGQQMNHSFRN